MRAVFLIAMAYLCGSLPIGVWVGGWVGIDIRQAGSGNIGATNVTRTAGARAGLLTLLGDLAKGALPAALARLLLTDPWLTALTAVAAVCGHLFSVFLHFSGGKGVATAFGAFVLLTPAAAVCSAVLFALVAVTTHYVSLASMLAALALPVVAVVFGYPAPLCGAATVVAGGIVLRHRANLVRLWHGVEPRFRIHRR
ncbi:MAG TPA: glycerol-3-phosphate 1-O-acyltransferase PlsY [Candidatus Margulisiibacteriota bacterium]|nr:glycerol-3-phosphate 1-O-acyltransferase PlsY [Candidatus Margulisiibacteriota bacterium]